METAVAVIASVAVGTVVSKIVTKVTGSDLLGTILGTAAGFGAGSLVGGLGSGPGSSAGAAMDAEIGAGADFFKLDVAGGLDSAAGLSQGAGSLLEGGSALAAPTGAEILNAGTSSAANLAGSSAADLVGSGAAKGLLGEATKVAAPLTQSAAPSLAPGMGTDSTLFSGASGAGASLTQSAGGGLMNWLGDKWAGLGPWGQNGLMQMGGQMVGGLFQGMAAQDKLDFEREQWANTGHYGVSNSGAQAATNPATEMLKFKAPTRQDGSAVVQNSTLTNLGNVSPNTSALQARVRQLEAENAALRNA